ncbi:odorant receptor 65a [Cotesia glomerata]|uniref:odorant receptor 65a n=1 Tax=Cotesia glomerata TaxID=32391 RepID=UPI001D004058|nr:odorant receptor 65a [Cotesia glomerata]XP_044580144.1 odorant receptor 65a [Cotesia glomerata]XP_044580146.1 odorant receptor 65a [Cotesia glomerata]
MRVVNWITTILVVVLSTADFFCNMDNIQEVSYNFGYILPMIATILKTLVIHRNQEAFHELIDKVHGPIKKLKYSSDLGIITEIQVAMTYQNFDFSMFILAITSVSLSCLLPIKTILRTRILPIRATFPFDETPSPLFEIIYAIEYYSLVTNNLWVLIHDPAVMGLIRWINIQLVVLQSNFRHCNNFDTPRATFSMSNENYEIALNYKYFKTTEKQREIHAFIPFTEDEVRVDQDSFIKRFKLCVFHHRRIIDVIDAYNNLFSLVFFAQIASDCMLTCIGLFQMALGLKKGRNIFRDLIMLLSGLCHLLYWSIYGDFLIKEHDALQRSIYDCGWENHFKTNDKQVIIIGLLQGLTPMVMTAGYFFIFSMETYLSIIQKSYSYFAILNTMMTEE